LLRGRKKLLGSDERFSLSGENAQETVDVARCGEYRGIAGPCRHREARAVGAQPYDKLSREG